MARRVVIKTCMEAELLRHLPFRNLQAGAAGSR